MSWLDYFSKTHKSSANVARDRLSIIVAREGRSKGEPNYLPELRQEILQVLARYEKIDLDRVNVNVESQGECEVLELNVILADPKGVRKAKDDAYEPFFPKASGEN